MTDYTDRTPREVALEGLIVQARQWLDLLTEEFDIDPQTTLRRSRILLGDQTQTTTNICLQDTLDALNSVAIMVKVTAANDP